MTKPLDLTDLAGHVAAMTCALAAWNDRTERKGKWSQDWFARLSDATATLRQEVEGFGGHFGKPGDGISLTLGGLKSSSTSGIQGACRNWLNAANKKLEEPE